MFIALFGTERVSGLTKLLFALFQSKAKQRNAKQSKAKECKAMQSKGMQSKGKLTISRRGYRSSLLFAWLMYPIGVGRSTAHMSVAILHQTIAVHLVLRAAACRYRGFLIWI